MILSVCFSFFLVSVVEEKRSERVYAGVEKEEKKKKKR